VTSNFLKGSSSKRALLKEGFAFGFEEAARRIPDGSSGSSGHPWRTYSTRFFLSRALHRSRCRAIGQAMLSVRGNARTRSSGQLDKLLALMDSMRRVRHSYDVRRPQRISYAHASNESRAYSRIEHRVKIMNPRIDETDRSPIDHRPRNISFRLVDALHQSRGTVNDHVQHEGLVPLEHHRKRYVSRIGSVDSKID